MDKATSFTNSLLQRLGLAGAGPGHQNSEQQKEIRRQPSPVFPDDFSSLGADLASNRIDLQVPFECKTVNYFYSL